MSWLATNLPSEHHCPWEDGINPNYYTAARRAQMKRGDKIFAVEVFEHYNWTCNICSEKIDRNLRFPNKRAATIDHIVPLSRGGQHVWDNVMPAHAECNFKKGNTIAS